MIQNVFCSKIHFPDVQKPLWPRGGMVDARDSKSRVRKGMSVRVRPRPYFFVKTFQKQLLRWYHREKRDLPWRRTRDPYHILVSEFMLQQTQVTTVIPYYHRFLKSFPAFAALANAPLGKVLKLWEGLGYYSRARNLHALSKIVHRQYGGRLPNDPEQLRALPGIGPYTAGAILSIAFHKDYAVLDGNVQRVLARHFGWRQDLKNSQMQKKLWALAESLIPPGEAGDYNQAMMDLGATICTPASPRCDICPAKADCRALKNRLVDKIPLKHKTKVIPYYPIGAGVVWKGKKLLISQRPLKGLLGGLWEFPGGKKRSSESLQKCVQREIQEELGIHVQVGSKIAAVDHAYSHFKITLHVYHCRYVSGTPQTIGCRAWRWVHPHQLKNYAFPAANQPIITRLTT
jgi:A/G-specific adenine glycosylase